MDGKKRNSAIPVLPLRFFSTINSDLTPTLFASEFGFLGFIAVTVKTPPHRRPVRSHPIHADCSVRTLIFPPVRLSPFHGSTAQEPAREHPNPWPSFQSAGNRRNFHLSAVPWPLPPLHQLQIVDHHQIQPLASLSFLAFARSSKMKFRGRVDMKFRLRKRGHRGGQFADSFRLKEASMMDESGMRDSVHSNRSWRPVRNSFPN